MSIWHSHPHLLLLIIHLLSLLPPPSLATSPPPLPSSVATTPSPPVSLPDCDDRCGDVVIPYPFGVGDGCFLADRFEVICSESRETKTPSLYSGYHILSISLNGGFMRVLTHVAIDCYYDDNENYSHQSGKELDRFYFSATRNKFTGTGCDTAAFLLEPAENISVGCLSTCEKEDSVKDGVCNGVGCCQTSNIPQGLQNITLFGRSFSDHEDVKSFNPCSYAFLVDQDYFHFNKSYYFSKNLSNHGTVPTVVDWAVGEGNCTTARMNLTSFLCKNNSDCYDPPYGDGYLCNCSAGFQGNPYIGCQDIDECRDPNKYPCDGRCSNTEGSYSCISHHDQLPNNHKHLFVKIAALCVGAAFMVLVTGSFLMCSGLKKRRLTKRKRDFFRKNGGLTLQDNLSQIEYAQNAFKIFTAEEMEEASNNFDKARIVGSGGFADVYKGYLSNGTAVAIKKPNTKSLKDSDNGQFINEVILLSKIQHQNVVTFLGCCLETEAPLLVYEFVANGTLVDHLHKQGTGLVMAWETRLKIAAETAGAVAYLHHDHRPAIIHSDIKPHNILLDDNYIAKVSDFGISKLAPENEIELYTKVKGTLGYLDPEFIQSGQLTEKSDVYSFGVVLLELLTGEKAIHFNRAKEHWCLVKFFRSSFDRGCFFGTLDKHIVVEGNMKQLKAVAEIALSCVNVKAEERPSMKEVAMELGSMMIQGKNRSWVKHESKLEETEHLPSKASKIYGWNASSSTGYSSGTGDHIMQVPLDDGR